MKQSRIGKVAKGGWKLRSILYGGVASPSYFRGRISEPSFSKSENGVITRTVFPAMPRASRKGIYVSPAGIASASTGLHITERLSSGGSAGTRAN